ncbi:alpha/beta hydrolase [Phenylobacterium sp.]|uniref:alpha/beta hydrolase n=1 Tax=Phenylobacterium sp. TaxID=1871053 RepID=UPI0035AEA6CF
MGQERYVDPDTAAFLAGFGGGPAAGEPTLAERRAGLAAAVAAFGPPPVEVGSVEDRAIPGPNGAVPLKIYRPVGGERDAPLVLHIHGGGWAIGDVDSYAPVARAYCAAGGCVVVDVDYRRAPEHRHPVALEDCRAALAWAAAHAQALGADPRRIVVAGDSAGGHLAAGICQTTDIPLAGQVLVYPVTSASAHADFASRRELGDGRYFLREFDILRAETEYFAPEEDREHAPASPLLAETGVMARQPPALVITAALDPLADEGRAYAQRLAEAGVPCEHVCAEGTIHGFVLFAGAIGAGRDAITRIGAWIAAV